MLVGVPVIAEVGSPLASTQYERDARKLPPLVVTDGF